MIASFILSRTLVPTMAMYLLKPHMPRPRPRQAEGNHARARLQRASRPGFRRLARGLSQPAGAGDARTPAFVIGFLGAGRLLRCWCRSWARTSSPPWIPARSPCMPAPPVGTRIEDTTQIVRPRSSARSASSSRQANWTPSSTISACNQSPINMIYNNSGTIGLQDGDIFISLNENHHPTADYVRTHARNAAAAFPGSDLFLPARRHHQPDPEFRLARAAGRAGHRHRSRHRRRLSRCRCCARCSIIPGLADARMQQSNSQPQLLFDADRSPHRPAGPDRAGRHQRDGHRPGRHRHNRAQFLAEPQERRLLPHGRPDAGISDSTRWQRWRTCRSPARPAAPAGAGRRWATSAATRRTAVVTHYNILPTIDLYATTQDRDLGAVSRDVQKVIDAEHEISAAGRHGHPARPGRDHEHRLLRPVLRPARRDCADLSADRGELPVLARSLRDHHRPARGAGRHCLDAVRHRHHPVGARADRRDHVHGRRHRQLDPGGQLRARAAGRHRRSRCSPRWKPASPVSARC